MRLVHVFNGTNDAYNNVKFLRQKGVEADLIVDTNDVGMSFPQWEDSFVDSSLIDVYHPTQRWDVLNKNWSHPSWIHYWNRGRLFKQRIFSLSKLYKMVERYDLIQVMVNDVFYLQSQHKPYILFDIGNLRCLPYRNDSWGSINRRECEKAKKVLFTNIDSIYGVRALKLRNAEFIPFAIDTNKYSPKNSLIRQRYDYEILLFSPTRHDWDVKGNDLLLKAFAKYLEHEKSACLVLVDWGYDVPKAKQLIKQLKIQEKVVFVRPMCKMELIEFYNAADIVIDQFKIGCYGTTALEAMSCKKPVLMYVDAPAFKEVMGEVPPVANACSVSDICDRLLELSHRKVRELLGVRSRRWVEKHYDAEKVADKYISIYEGAL